MCLMGGISLFSKGMWMTLQMYLYINLSWLPITY